jgi:chaperonin GroEL
MPYHQAQGRKPEAALQNAASVSILLLTSDALIAEMPKKGEGKKGGHGGDHDMY